MSRTYAPTAFLLLALSVLSACPQRGHVWIAPGSTASNLRFLIGSRRGSPGGVALGVLRVDHCGTRWGSQTEAVWVTWTDSGSTTGVKEIVYGEVPLGWSESHPAPALTPGCYEAGIAASPGIVEFDVDSAGQVHERPKT